MKHIIIHNILTDAWHSFRHAGIYSQLLLTVQLVNNSKQQIDTIALDFTRASDEASYM